MREKDIRPKELFNKFLALVKKDINKYFSDKTSNIKVKCLACDSDQLIEKFDKNGFAFQECSKCKTFFANPRPSYEGLVKFYTDSESVKFYATHFYKLTEDNRRKHIFKPRAKFIKRILDKYEVDGIIDYIDIGAGYGTMLEEMKKINIAENIYALEPSMDLVNVLNKKGFQVFNSTLENLGDSYFNKFDFATCFELLEHIHKPKLFIKKINKILRNNGLFYLTTLNGQGYDILILGKKSKSISPPQHLNFFNPNSLKLLLEKCGFKILKIMTPGNLDVDIVKNYCKEFGENFDHFTMKVINAEEKVRENFQNFLQENLLSSHMAILAQKKEE